MNSNPTSKLLTQLNQAYCQANKLPVVSGKNSPERLAKRCFKKNIRPLIEIAARKGLSEYKIGKRNLLIQLTEANCHLLEIECQKHGLMCTSVHEGDETGMHGIIVEGWADVGFGSAAALPPTLLERIVDLEDEVKSLQHEISELRSSSRH